MLGYNADLFDPETVGRFAHHYQLLVDALLKESQRGISTSRCLMLRSGSRF